MKKQLILSALITSLSFTYVAFTTENNLLIKNPLARAHENKNKLFEIAKKQQFEPFNKKQKLKINLIKPKPKKSKKHSNILISPFIESSLGVVARHYFISCSKKYLNISLKKTALSILAFGLSFFSKHIIKSAPTEDANETEKKLQEKNNIISSGDRKSTKGTKDVCCVGGVMASLIEEKKPIATTGSQ